MGSYVLGGAVGRSSWSTPADKRSSRLALGGGKHQALTPRFARAKHSLQKRTFVGGNSRSRTCLSPQTPIPVRRSSQKMT